MIYTGGLFHEDSQLQQASIVYPLPSRLTTDKRIRYDWYVSLLFCGFPKPTRCFFTSKHDSTEPSSRSQKRLKGTGGTGSWQTGGCLVSGLMAKPALCLFAGVFLFIKTASAYQFSYPIFQIFWSSDPFCQLFTCHEQGCDIKFVFKYWDL